MFQLSTYKNAFALDLPFDTRNPSLSWGSSFFPYQKPLHFCLFRRNSKESHFWSSKFFIGSHQRFFWCYFFSRISASPTGKAFNVKLAEPSLAASHFFTLLLFEIVLIFVYCSLISELTDSRWNQDLSGCLKELCFNLPTQVFSFSTKKFLLDYLFFLSRIFFRSAWNSLFSLQVFA